MSLVGSDMQASTAILGSAEPFLRGRGASGDSSSGVGGLRLAASHLALEWLGEDRHFDGMPGRHSVCQGLWTESSEMPMCVEFGSMCQEASVEA